MLSPLSEIRSPPLPAVRAARYARQYAVTDPANANAVRKVSRTAFKNEPLGPFQAYRRRLAAARAIAPTPSNASGAASGV